MPATRHLAESSLVGNTADDDNSPEWTIPVSCKLFEEQYEDKMLRQKCALNKNNEHRIKSFSQDSNTVHELITHNDKICAPKMSEKHMVQWHHEVLCHPGATRTEEMIAQHFY